MPKKIKVKKVGETNDKLIEETITELEKENNYKLNKYATIDKAGEQEKLDLIDECFEDNEKDLTKDLDKIEKKIRKLYDGLTGYNHVRIINTLNEGDIIRHVNETLDHISTWAAIVDIARSNEDMNTIKLLTLYNPENNTIWKIVPHKYYIFQKKTKVDKFLDQINKYLKNKN
jgi:hypothetical protein